MDKKKKIIIAVSAVVVIAVVAAVVILTSNFSKEEKYTENTVVEIVTDENGEAVTDENGDVVTVVSEKEGSSSTGNSTDKSDGSESSGSGAEQTNSAGGNNSNQNENEITSAGNNGNNGGNSGSANDETNNNGSSEAEQEKPKARNVTVDVVLPYYNKQETEVTILYKAEGDEKYSKLEPVKLKLDKSGKKESFDLGELKGEVSVTVTFSGIKISENSITIAANENTGTIKPVTGIEILEGEDD